MMKKGSATKLPPAWLINTINHFRTFLIRLNRNMFPGNVVLYEQFQYFWLLPSLYVAAKLDIAALLENHPMTAGEIAERVGADSANMARLMRALSSQGVFRQQRDGRYALNAIGSALLDQPGSLRNMLLHLLGPVNWNLMSNMEYAVMTGKDPFSEKYGKGLYEFLNDHPDEGTLFDKSMTSHSDLGLAPILKAYDFPVTAEIADIGGGEGYLLANILQRNPGCRGILFDRAEALEKAPDMLAAYQVEDRVKVIPGDFFDSVPCPADIFLLKNIIHNWDDEKSAVILGNVRQGMKPDGKILIIEMVVPMSNGPSMAKLLDIQMMLTMTGGRERTADEYRVLLEKAGFSMTRIIPTIAPICLVEAKMKES